MGLVREQDAFRKDLVKLFAYAECLGFLVTIGEVERTKEQQERYVAAGLSQTMRSNHLKRLAADLFFYREDSDGRTTWIKYKMALQAVGDYWESLDPKNVFDVGKVAKVTVEILELPA
jgi:hypothetical protein